MCGIFGIINNKKRSRFDKMTFNILGIQNDARGGDSCGVFIDKKVEYGVNELKLYSNFFKTSDLISNTKYAEIALGHCRRASVGSISLKTAQPVVIYNEEGKIDFTVVHNGTIHNYKELANKYIPNINITGMTDSQVMARIFYYAGYECLSEYIGGAAFIIVDYRNGKHIYLWKGKSKNYIHYDANTAGEERPLYFVQDEQRTVISSIGNLLPAIVEKGKVYSVPSNKLIEVKADEIKLIKEVDRSKCYQLVSDTSNTSLSTTGTFFNTNYYGYDYSKEKIKINPLGIYTDSANMPLHGEYNLDALGAIYDYDNTYIKKLWFWDGVILYNEKCYDFLEVLCSYYCIDYSELKYYAPVILNYLSPYPTEDVTNMVLDYNPEVECYKAYDTTSFTPYSGSVHRYLSTEEISYNKGILGTVKNNNLKYDAFKDLQKLINSCNVNITDLYNTLIA